MPTKTLDVKNHEAHTHDMKKTQHPLAAAVQPLIDEWLASEEGIIAECERDVTEQRLAS